MLGKSIIKRKRESFAVSERLWLNIYYEFPSAMEGVSPDLLTTRYRRGFDNRAGLTLAAKQTICLGANKVNRSVRL